MHDRHLSRAHAHPGFALTEVIVAISLLIVAVLALAATGTRLMSFGDAAARRMAAVARVRAVTDSLLAAACPGLVSGADSSGGVLVTWRVTPGAASRTVLVSAAFVDHATHQLQLEGAVPCD